MWNLKFKSGSKKTPRNLMAGVGLSEETRDKSTIFSKTFRPSLLLLHTTTTFCVIFERENTMNLVLSG